MVALGGSTWPCLDLDTDSNGVWTAADGPKAGRDLGYTQRPAPSGRGERARDPEAPGVLRHPIREPTRLLFLVAASATLPRPVPEPHLRLDGQLTAEVQLTETPALKLAARRLGKRPWEDDYNRAGCGAAVDRELTTDPAAGFPHVGATARPPPLGDDQVAAGPVRDRRAFARPDRRMPRCRLLEQVRVHLPPHSREHGRQSRPWHPHQARVQLACPDRQLVGEPVNLPGRREQGSGARRLPGACPSRGSPCVSKGGSARRPPAPIQRRLTRGSLRLADVAGSSPLPSAVWATECKPLVPGRRPESGSKFWRGGDVR